MTRSPSRLLAPASRSRLRIAVVGCGMVAGYGHLPALTASRHWDLIGVCDTDPARLRDAQQRHRVAHACRDYRELFRTASLDAVAVATHVDTHAAIGQAAADHGLHILCEKPLARTPAEMRGMIVAARRARRLLAVNLNSRSAAQYRLARRFAGQGRLGRLKVIRVVYNWSAHQWQPPARLDQFMRHGGPIVDSGVHFFDFCRWLTGAEFVRQAAIGVPEPGYRAPSHVISLAVTASGVCCLVEAGWLYTRGAKQQASRYILDIIGDRGTYHYDMADATARLYTARGTTRVPCPEEKDFPLVYDLFARSIRRGRLLGLASGEDAAAATTAAYRALRGAQRVPPLAATRARI